MKRGESQTRGQGQREDVEIVDSARRIPCPLISSDLELINAKATTKERGAARNKAKWSNAFLPDCGDNRKGREEREEAVKLQIVLLNLC